MTGLRDPAPTPSHPPTGEIDPLHVYSAKVAKVRRFGIIHFFRSFGRSVYLGWKIETNWTRLWVYLALSIAKPLGSSLIIVFLYMIVAGAAAGKAVSPTDATFGFLFIGNTFFIFVMTTLMGMGRVIEMDREHFQVLSNIATSPTSLFVYMLGRVVGRVAVNGFGIVITLLFGIYVLGIPAPLQSWNWPLFSAIFLLGLTSLGAFGLMLGAIALITAHHSSYMYESAAAVLYLMSGVVFPLVIGGESIMPAWTLPISRSLPTTYWVEGLRRAILGGSIDEVMNGVGDWQLVLLLAVSTILFFGAGLILFRISEWIARRKGLLSGQTTY